MKVRIEVDEGLLDEYIVIHCRQLDSRILGIQEALIESSGREQTILLHKANIEYYIELEKILFFESEEKLIHAHTKNEIYDTEYKLYELEELLPGYFMRISKSTIINLKHVYSITRNLTASSVVEFNNCHKVVYVSRNYYKALVERLAEKRRKL